MVRQPVSISITYCAECGYEEPTLRLVRRLMDEFHMYLRRIEIVPAVHGELEVVVDGDLIHSTRASGLFPKADDIVAVVRQRLDGAPAPG
ncbi:MAG: Rdx family protein [Chloroflexi bacterium]|nr:Rdx family protein [Chloroflexota bacterium]